MHECQVILSEDGLFTSPSTNGFVQIQHPRTNSMCTFYLKNTADNGYSLYEVQRVHELHRSWILDGIIKSDGCLFVITPFDPLFIALSYLLKEKRFTTIETLLDDSDPDQTQKYTLLKLSSLASRLHLIADVKEVGSNTVFRYSEEKTLSWLSTKVEKVKNALVDKNVFVRPVNVSGEATTVDFGVACLSEMEKQVHYNHYAWAIVADCMPLVLAEKLAEHLNVDIASHSNNNPLQSPVKVDKLDEENTEPKEKRKNASNGPVEDYMKKAEPPAKPVAKKPTSRLANIRGVQSITNFFGKK